MSLAKENKSALSVTKDLVNIVNCIRRVPWSNERIDRDFVKRSAVQILNDKDTFYMNACLDLTLVTASMLKENFLEHSLVIEEHAKTEEYPFNRIHFALEFTSPHEGPFFINFKSGNAVKVGYGQYKGRDDLERVGMFRVNGRVLNPEKALHENLGFKTFEEATVVFRGYTPETFKLQIERMKNDNTAQKYGDYLSKYGSPLSIDPLN